MAWRIETADGGRWVADDGDSWLADERTELFLDTALEAGWGVPATPTGPVYVPQGRDDELAVWLHALDELSQLGEVVITGEPPSLPGSEMMAPDGVVE